MTYYPELFIKLYSCYDIGSLINTVDLETVYVFRTGVRHWLVEIKEDEPRENLPVRHMHTGSGNSQIGGVIPSFVILMGAMIYI